jgi:hypothetical protein
MAGKKPGPEAETLKIEGDWKEACRALDSQRGVRRRERKRRSVSRWPA